MLFTDNNHSSISRKQLTHCRRSLSKPAVALVALLGLAGCEADLNLQGVEQEQAKNIIRTDQYQEMVVNDGVITLVASQGLIMSSSDQANSWQRQVIDGKPNFIGIAACPDNSLIALSFDHRLWVSTDKGSNWSSQPIPTREDVMDIDCAPDGSYWVTGSFSTLLKSSDKGVSWQENTLNEDALITHIEFFDSENAVIAGEFGFFYKTIDGGQNWESVGVIGEELYPLALHFSDPQTGWAGGLSGVIMKTTDGGQNWTQQTTAVKSPIYDFVSDGEDLFATGDHGSILALKNDEWVRLESPKIPVYLSAGHMLDNKHLLVAGGWGALFSIPTAISDSSNN